MCFTSTQETDEQVDDLGDIDSELVDPILKHGGGQSWFGAV